MIEFSAHFRPLEPLGPLSLWRLSTRTGHSAKLPAALGTNMVMVVK